MLRRRQLQTRPPSVLTGVVGPGITRVSTAEAIAVAIAASACVGVSSEALYLEAILVSC